MLKKIMVYKILVICVAISLNKVIASHAQEEDSMGTILILREAQEFGDTTVAVEAHLIGDILQAKITARMHGTKPKIHNAIIVGPGLGRLSIESKEVLLATAEEERPYPTSKKDRAFIDFRQKAETKIAKGALTRELMIFKIPRNKIVKGKKYQLWVQVESLQRGGKYKTFKFHLDNLPGLML